MRHFLASRAVAALALRVRQAPRKARLVARAGCPQRGRAGTLGAAGGAIALPPIAVAADQHCRAACSTEIASSGRLHGPWGRWETRRQRPLRERLRAQRPRRLARVWGATLGMTWRFEPVSRLRCHRPSPIVRASATRVPNALPPDCTNTPPAIGAPGSGAFPVALRAPSNAPDPIKQTAAIRSPDQGHAVPCRRWTPDLCGNRPPLTCADVNGPVVRIETLHACGRLAGVVELAVVVVLDDPGLVPMCPLDDCKPSVKRKRGSSRELVRWGQKNRFCGLRRVLQ